MADEDILPIPFSETCLAAARNAWQRELSKADRETICSVLHKAVKELGVHCTDKDHTDEEVWECAANIECECMKSASSVDEYKQKVSKRINHARLKVKARIREQAVVTMDLTNDTSSEQRSQLQQREAPMNMTPQKLWMCLHTRMCVSVHGERKIQCTCRMGLVLHKFVSHVFECKDGELCTRGYCREMRPWIVHAKQCKKGLKCTKCYLVHRHDPNLSIKDNDLPWEAGANRNQDRGPTTASLPTMVQKANAGGEKYADDEDIIGDQAAASNTYQDQPAEIYKEYRCMKLKEGCAHPVMKPPPTPLRAHPHCSRH
jgi:hypothetical protein